MHINDCVMTPSPAYYLAWVQCKVIDQIDKGAFGHSETDGQMHRQTCSTSSLRIYIYIYIYKYSKRIIIIHYKHYNILA